MSRTRNQEQPRKKDLAAEAFAEGMRLVRANRALAAIGFSTCRQEDCEEAPDDGLVRVDSDGVLHVHPKRRADPVEWAWAVAHGALHLGFGHVTAATGMRAQPDRFDVAARCVVVNRFLLGFPIGRTPADLPMAYPDGDEEQLAARWRRDGIPPMYERCGTAGAEPDQLLVPWDSWLGGRPPDWQLAFAHALTRTVATAMDMAGGRRDSMRGGVTPLQPWERALSWFVSSYPLLGGIAAGITIVADAELARAHGISVAAVDAGAAEIYINPLLQLDDEEWRFVLAHEMLHAALRHGDRCGARDPYLFNVACDYVINAWLVEMQVGTMPEGLLYDQELKDLSAEEVYDRLATDLRRMRRLATLRGKGVGDILGGPLGPPRDYVDLDEFYRRGLARRPRPARAAEPRVPARRTGGGHPRAQPSAAALGRPTRPLVRRVRAPPRAGTDLRAPSPPPGGHPRHPTRRALLPARGDRPLHLRRRPGHLRLHGPHPPRQGTGRHRLVRRGP